MTNTRIRLNLSPELVAAIRQTPEYRLNPILAKAVRAIVEGWVIRARKIQGESKTQNP